MHQITIVMMPSHWPQNFGPNGLSAPAQGLCTCTWIKSWKNVHKSESRAIFWNMQPVMKVIRPFCLHQNNCPGLLSLLALQLYIYMYEVNKIYKIMRTGVCERIFLELVQNDGNNKSFKMLPELVQSGCMPMPWGFFQMMTLTIFYDRVKFVPDVFCIGDSL